MAKLVITGDKKQLEGIETRSRLIAAKYGLKMVMTDDKKSIEPKKDVKPVGDKKPKTESKESNKK